MTYRRVIPRDLFNEAKLLNCLGRLWIVANEKIPPGVLDVRQPDHTETWSVRQDRSDGSLTLAGVVIQSPTAEYEFYTPLNSRDKYPLYVYRTDDPDQNAVRALTEDGELSPEFREGLRFP
jgi:hypothetical protein